MSAVASGLLRRGLEAANAPDGLQLSPWGVLVVAITGLVFLLAGEAIQYTYGLIIPTLAAAPPSRLSPRPSPSPASCAPRSVTSRPAPAGALVSAA
ncbi:hypothetical protein VTN02DRAFT_1211 [Thermoascus thermophilus]